MLSKQYLAFVCAALATHATAVSWSLPQWLSRRTVEERTILVAEQIIYVPTDVYEGDNFFGQFDFYSDKDPTNGLVNYLPREAAMNATMPLAFVQDGQAIIRVDNWTTLASGQPRNSVRLESKKTYDEGLFILDLEHAPVGCAVWPAYWTLGRAEGWPNAGEIDIMEGVHNNQHDQVTWHTAPGCNLTSPGNFSGTAIHTNCYANEVGGCGIVDWSQSSFGSSFNSYGGGVYAMRWDEDSIDVWFFYRATVPKDILEGHPDPTFANWGLPSASMSSKGCDIKKYFRAHAIIINITLCGDWAGNSFQADGCIGSCNDRVMDPANMNNASWVLNSLKVYDKKTLQGRTDSASSLLPSREAALAAAAIALLAV